MIKTLNDSQVYFLVDEPGQYPRIFKSHPGADIPYERLIKMVDHKREIALMKTEIALLKRQISNMKIESGETKD